MQVQTISKFLYLVLAVFLGGGWASRCGAELQPSEIAIVAARGNRDSENLASYYARMRNVPPANICLVDLPAGETCPRDQWSSAIRPAIQKWLTEHDPEQKVRCLVTLWGDPLRIGPATADAKQLRHEQFLATERSHRIELLTKVLTEFDGLASGPAPASEAESKGADKAGSTAEGVKNGPGSGANAVAKPGAAASEQTPEITRLQTRLETALQAAQARIAKLTHEEERIRAAGRLQQLATAVGGINVLLPALSQQLSASNPPNPVPRTEFDTLRGRLLGYLDSKTLFEQLSTGIERDAMVLALAERTGGLIASVQWLDEQLETVKKRETASSFDSELALVMWPDDYQLLRWQHNYLRPGYINSQLPKYFRTLMVSRIDAPTLRLAKGLIDTAIEVEKKGLRGKFYVDARGLAAAGDANVQPGSYADYDRGLLTIAKAIDDQTDFDVVLENTPQLFQPGQCKDAAVYCGWYSLGKYVDAFDWVPGAVGYHLASAEATTLRDPGSQVWCKKMLEDGVCATIGPAYEPYLAAFPRPDEFLALLVRGDLTLVECYAATSPFNSWMMTLIGDPLYRPFKYRATAAPTSTGVPPGAPAPPPPATPPPANGSAKSSG